MDQIRSFRLYTELETQLVLFSSASLEGLFSHDTSISYIGAPLQFIELTSMPTLYRIYQVNELRYLAESLHLSFYNRVGIEPTAYQALDGLIPQLSDSQSYYEPSVLVIHMPQHSHTNNRTKNLFINSLEQFKLACGFQDNSN